MVFTRTAARIVKPVSLIVKACYSGLSQSRYTPIISTTCDLEHPKRRIFGKSKKDPLDLLVGTWYETEVENFDLLLRAAGCRPDIIAETKDRRGWVAYARDGDDWLSYYGTLKKDGYHTAHFKLNEFVDDTFITGEPAKFVAFQKDDKMVQRLKTCSEPPKVLQTVLKVVGKNDMLMGLKLNKVKATKKLKRIKSDDERMKIIGFLM